MGLRIRDAAVGPWVHDGKIPALCPPASTSGFGPSLHVPIGGGVGASPITCMGSKEWGWMDGWTDGQMDRRMSR